MINISYATYMQDVKDAGVMYFRTKAKTKSSPFAPTTGAKETMRRINTYIKDGRDQLAHITY